MRLLRVLAAVVLPVTLLHPVSTEAQTADPYQHLVGSIHEHSGYSDGWPGTTPATYYEKGKAEGLDFMAGSEHSDNYDIPVTANEACIGELAPQCAGTDADSLDKWNATQRQAAAISDEDFRAIRGFEWTSDRFGHINVLFSRNDTNAKADGGYVGMETFWNWFDRPPGLDGGADGLGVFNHPGAKSLDDADPAFNWNDFAYVPSADHRMVGIEVYNDQDEFGTTRGPAEGYYVRALDKGWHVGAVGAEDLHGDPGSRDDYGAGRWPKTVILAENNSVASLRSAMLERRFYAVRRNDGLRLTFTADGQPMGSRLAKAPGQTVDLVATTNRPEATVEVVTSGGRVVSNGSGPVTWGPDDRYYFMRVKQAGEFIGYSSPVWITTTPVTQGEWLAGDLHVHSCYSHDSWCPQEGDNEPEPTDPSEFYTFGMNVENRFTEAAVRGLDYLAITDHNDVRSQSHGGFGAHGITPIPGYENSLNGHAQMLGATKVYAKGDGSESVNAMANELRADGGVFQINHPADAVVEALDETCSKFSHLDWGYGFEVVPDTIEVWNIGHFLQPPIPSGNSNDDSERFWECFLNRGHRIGATGGSDSHWASTSLVQGPGNPTTWAFAKDRDTASVLQALREGRTSISMTPPVYGNVRLLLEADADGGDANGDGAPDGDGTFEAVIGDEVPPGSRMRVRAEGIHTPGLVEVRANGSTIIDDQPLAPGGAITFNAPENAGWVRAKLNGFDLRDERTAACDPLLGTQTTFCRNALVVLGLTSPIYLAEPEVATQLSYTGPLAPKGKIVPLTARLSTEGGAPLAGETVTFTNGATTLSGVTNDQGVASATMVFLKRDNQVIDIAFDGRAQYLASRTSVTLWDRSK